MFPNYLLWLNENITNEGTIHIDVLSIFIFLNAEAFLFFLYKERETHAVVTLCRSFTCVLWNGHICVIHVLLGTPE